jgi:CHAT domain-containing protein/Tfp pilus assembly protein PilF
MRRFLLLIFALFFELYSFAQQQTTRFYFPISTLERGEGVVNVLISQGSKIGLSENDPCIVWGLHYSDFPSHNETDLGEGYLYSLNDTAAVAIVEEYDTASVKRIYKGDMLAFDLPLKDNYQGIFYNLIAYHIYLNDQYNGPIYDFDQVYFDYSPELERALIDSMVMDIRTLADWLVDNIDDQPITEGRYSGSMMIPVMQSATAQGLQDFLWYVNEYPAKYMGKEWKLGETYATWLINGAPLVSSSIGKWIDDSNTQDEIKNLFETYQEDIDTDVILDLGVDAEKWVKKGLKEEALERMKKVLILSELYGDDDRLGWAYFQYGRVYDELNDDSASVVWYEQSVQSFEGSKNTYALTYALNNLASSYDNLGEKDPTIKNYRKALAAKKKLYEDNVSYDYYEDIAIGEDRLGDALVKYDLYDSAVVHYENSIHIYKELQMEEEIDDVMEDMANAQAQKGDLERAVQLHQQRIELAEAREDYKIVADAYFDIGYTYNGYGDEYEKSIPFYQQSFEEHMSLGDTTMATLSISNVAQSYWSLKKLDLSIENHLKTIALAEAFGEKERIANSWDKLADLYAEIGNPTKSLEAYEKVLQLYEDLGDPKFAETLDEVGDVYKAAKEYLKAINYYERSVEEAQKAGKLATASDAYFDIADAYYADSKYQKAKEYYKLSMSEAAKTYYPDQEIYCLGNLALIAGISDQYAKSDSLHQLALSKAEQSGDQNMIGFCKYNLGYTASRKRDFALSEQLFNESLELFEELEDLKWQINVLYAQQNIYAQRGDFDKALNTIDVAMSLADSIGDVNSIASGFLYKSDLYLRVLGEFEKAWEMQIKSIDLYQTADNNWGIANSYTGLGNIKNLSGENVSAIEYYQKADSLYTKLGSHYSRATPINNIGTIYFAQGDYQKAMDHVFKALRILDSLGVKDASRTLYVSNIGEAKMELKEYEEAEKWLQQALREAEEVNSVDQISTSKVILARLRIETEEYKKAEKLLKEALELQNQKGLKTHEISTMFTLGKLAYLQKNEANYHFLDESIQRALDMGYEKELWETYYYRGLVAQDEGDLEKSKEFLINAIESMEKLQSRMVGGEEAKKLFGSGEKQIKVYASLVDVLILKGEVELAMQYLERSNIESLRNKFKQLDINFKDEKANEKLSKEKELKRKLDNLDKALMEEKSSASSEEKLKKLEESKTIAENEYLKFVNTTINTNPELSRHFSGGFHPRKLKTDKNRRLIPDNLVVLSYLPANEKLYIFAATSDTVIAKVVNVGTDELNRNIKFMYNFASMALDGHKTDALRNARGDVKSTFPEEYNAEDSRYKEISEKLFNWVIAPIREELDKKEMVVVVPTGMLHFLPFQMLGETLSNGKFDFLIEHYTLFYAHSLEMLYQEPQPIDEFSILAMANADQTLPATEQEVEDLKALYPETEVFIHENASEDKAKAYNGKHNILHFATHGNLDYFDYHKSYLLLAPDQTGTEDGKLTIEEVWEIEDIYSYNMVTLSACKTAVTDDFSTGWAVSPATSFIDAGAPTVVASLWAVNDESTALLMKYFYRNLKKMTKVEALRQAQIELSQHEKFGHPYYWSPFILIGDWR